jgi:hypothetical protein
LTKAFDVLETLQTAHWKHSADLMIDDFKKTLHHLKMDSAIRFWNHGTCAHALVSGVLVNQWTKLVGTVWHWTQSQVWGQAHGSQAPRLQLMFWSLAVLDHVDPAVHLLLLLFQSLLNMRMSWWNLQLSSCMWWLLV